MSCTNQEAIKRTLRYLESAGIVLTDVEKENITVFDFGLNDLENVGLELLVYVNTLRVCAKELVLFPRQSCVEHLHPTIGDITGKEETFRCRWGKVYLYVPGEPTRNMKARIPGNMKNHVTVFHEIELNPGQQYTLCPDTLHWFQAGPEGAVISEFSTTNTDDVDRFTDPRIKR
jgi:D-lyxose ketol-isomerase